MILIADSGSTKTDWAVVDNGRMVASIATQGINPFHQDNDNIGKEIAHIKGREEELKQQIYSILIRQYL